jgi:hypothetical protein
MSGRQLSATHLHLSTYRTCIRSFQEVKVGSETKSARLGSGKTVSVGERVTIEGSDLEYVVLSVDHATERMELLRLNSVHIESDVPVSRVLKKLEAGTRPSIKEE